MPLMAGLDEKLAPFLAAFDPYGEVVCEDRPLFDLSVTAFRESDQRCQVIMEGVSGHANTYDVAPGEVSHANTFEFNGSTFQTSADEFQLEDSYISFDDQRRGRATVS